MARPRRYPAADVFSIAKQCSMCGESRPLAKYNKDKTTVDGLASTCYVCMGAKTKEKYRTNPEYRRSKKAKDTARLHREIATRSHYRCNICKLSKPRDIFDEDQLRISLISRKCKDCLYNPPTVKRCSGCKEMKSLDGFWKSKRGVLGRNSFCKPCSVQRNKEWLKDNAEAKFSVRKRQIFRKYHMSWATFEALFSSQGGCCAVCRRQLLIAGNGTCVDHCHDTGAVRGILCRNCNSGLGQFGDKIDLIEAAYNYLFDRKMT